MYVENAQESTKKKKKTIRTNSFGKAASYRINTQKSVNVLYTNNEHF